MVLVIASKSPQTPTPPPYYSKFIMPYIESRKAFVRNVLLDIDILCIDILCLSVLLRQVHFLLVSSS